MVVVCEKRKTILKIKKIWYFNEMLCKTDNLTLSVLKSEYVKLNFFKKKILILNQTNFFVKTDMKVLGKDHQVYLCQKYNEVYQPIEL